MNKKTGCYALNIICAVRRMLQPRTVSKKMLVFSEPAGQRKNGCRVLRTIMYRMGLEIL
jgi:hypothetical protein